MVPVGRGRSSQSILRIVVLLVLLYSSGPVLGQLAVTFADSSTA